MIDNEYIGKKVRVLVPAKSTISQEEIRPDAVHHLEKACAREGLHATDIKLVWQGSWAEAIASGTLVTASEVGDIVELMVYLYEATAREEVAA
jgi:hypothetical protein